MKKFTKGMLIAAGIFGAVGIGLTAAGGVMGASMSELTAMIITTATTVTTVRIMPALLMRMRKMALYIS